MTRNELGEVRRSQAVATFGPGAIIDFRVGGYRGSTVSVVATGLDQWDEGATARGVLHPQSISEPRLERALHVRGFRLAPVQPNESRQEDVLVGVRFPRWLQCPGCDRIGPVTADGYWAGEPGDPRRWCPECSKKRRRVYGVPVRLVAACNRGHLDDFPWSWWAHSGEADHVPQLRLSQGRGSGLASLVVVCDVDPTIARRSLAGSFGERGLGVMCMGRRPWLDSDEHCDRPLRAVQRGASNLYFALMESALTVPPWSDAVQKRLGIYWADIAGQPTQEERRSLIAALHLDQRTGISLEDLIVQVEQRMKRMESSPDLRTEEYARLSEGIGDSIEADSEFRIEPELIAPELRSTIALLNRVTRLREVRALRGFTRLEPYAGSKDNDRVSKLSSTDKDWLPALEVRGEGVFLALPESALMQWEARPNVSVRLAQLQSRGASGGDEAPSARSVLLHTLGHMVMAELATKCGYSYAALRERVYAGQDMAGILIYTGSADSEGTLGGLARQGRSDHFLAVLRDALRRAEWCANDPLCADGRLSLSDRCSLASCYACVLAPETSCERFNQELDRGFVVGTPEEPSIGYFAAIL